MRQIYTNNLCVGYGDKVVVKDINIECRAGEILVLIGPNGGGKSTLLKSLAGHIRSLSGDINILGKNIKDYKKIELARVMSMMLTDRVNTELSSVKDVVLAGRYPYTGRFGFFSEEDRQIANEAMALTGITELSDCDFMKLSDGQRQRVMLARALCQEPDVILLDEPTSFLDIKYKLEFMTLLKNIATEKKVAIVMSLHELELARAVADKIACVGYGRIDRYGEVSDIFKDSYILDFFGVLVDDCNSALQDVINIYT